MIFIVWYIRVVFMRLCQHKLAPLSLSPSLYSATVNPEAGDGDQPALLANMLTRDHKPEDPSETRRVEDLGMLHTTQYVHTSLVLFILAIYGVQPSALYHAGMNLHGH